MESSDFAEVRKHLGKTQRQLAQLLGTSLKAVSSYEQGWRAIPGHVERQLYFLIAKKGEGERKQKNCWDIKKCPSNVKKLCPAWEFHSGKLCWFINGTICEGDPRKNWQEKIEICKECEVFKALL